MARARLFWRILGATATAVPASSLYVLYKYRPRGSHELEYHERYGGADPAPTNFIERWLLNLGGSTMVTLMGFASRMSMHYIHQIDLVDEAKLHALIRSE